MKRIKRRIRRRIQKPAECFFCKQKVAVDYKEVDTLRRFISERGKIIGRQVNGLCQRHQLDLARSIKRARYLALLPYIVRPS